MLPKMFVVLDRFGIPVAAENGASKSNVDPDADEKKKKRAERYAVCFILLCHTSNGDNLQLARAHHGKGRT